MDIKEQYKELASKNNEHLPIKAFPIRELVQIFRKNGHPYLTNKFDYYECS